MKSIGSGCPVNCFLCRAPKLCSNACFFSRLPVHQIVLRRVFFSSLWWVGCRAPNHGPIHVFLAVSRAKLYYNACFFFPRFVARCRAPNRAPMRVFLSCVKLCCVVPTMLKVRALVIVFFRALKDTKSALKPKKLKLAALSCFPFRSLGQDLARARRTSKT